VEAAKVLLDLPEELLIRIVKLLASPFDIGRLDCVARAFHHGLPPAPSVVASGVMLRCRRGNANKIDGPPPTGTPSMTQALLRDERWSATRVCELHKAVQDQIWRALVMPAGLLRVLLSDAFDGEFSVSFYLFQRLHFGMSRAIFQVVPLHQKQDAASGTLRATTTRERGGSPFDVPPTANLSTIVVEDAEVPLDSIGAQVLSDGCTEAFISNMKQLRDDAAVGKGTDKAAWYDYSVLNALHLIQRKSQLLQSAKLKEAIRRYNERRLGPMFTGFARECNNDVFVCAKMCDFAAQGSQALCAAKHGDPPRALSSFVTPRVLGDTSCVVPLSLLAHAPETDQAPFEMLLKVLRAAPAGSLQIRSDPRGSSS